MLNNCQFIGRTGKPVELKFTPSGDAVATVSLACSESYKDKAGNKVEKTEWINLVVWRKLAEIMAKFVNKGDLIFVSGKMATRKWTDRDGNDRYSTEIIVSDMKMLGSKSDGERSAAPARTARETTPDPHGNSQYEEPPFDPDSDIPF
jgi:single-strand DNA-binding protein